MFEQVLETAHGATVLRRRVRVLASALADQVPDGASVLDIGAGDGSMGEAIRALRPSVRLRGIDVFRRPRVAYPVDTFDGLHIPHGDDSFDVAMFVDVLHHTADPFALLAEAARVAPVIVIKDHLREGRLAETTLRFMDWVGNSSRGVALPYTFWSRVQWKDSFRRASLETAFWDEHLGLYPFPFHVVFDRSLHFVARLRRA